VLASEGRLREIPGVGEAIEKKLRKYWVLVNSSFLSG
jgi:hypothetical protein